MEGMPVSIGYTNNSSQPNQESSSSKLLLPTTERNIESGVILSPNQTQTQTLDQHHHQFNAQYQQQTQREQGGREPTQDPDQPQFGSTATTAGASNSNKPPQAQPEANHVAASIRYRECLKNHAASIGGHVVDGCGDFMPSGDEGTAEALKCAACECHRNFHRRESQGELQQLMSSFYHAQNHNGNNRIRTNTNHHIQPPSSQQCPHLHPHHHHQFSHPYSHSLASPTTGGLMMMAFGGAGRGPAESSNGDLNMFHSDARGAQPVVVPPSFSISKKRFRTKFTIEQKDRMHEVAENLGWKIQKQDDEQIQQLCDELGVKRQVFKVWMHNNKQAMKNKQHEKLRTEKEVQPFH